MTDTSSTNAERQARHKAKLADAGVKQLNLMAPVAAHAVLREIASRTRAGEDLTDVLMGVAQRVAGGRAYKARERNTALLLALEALPSAPKGQVNIAARLSDKSNGGIRTRLKKLDLTYENRTFSGPVDAAIVVDLKSKVIAADGAFITE